MHSGTSHRQRQLLTQYRILRKGDCRIQPALLLGQLTQPGRFAATHQTQFGDCPVGVPQAHTDQYMTILMHLEPPIRHRAPLQRG